MSDRRGHVVAEPARAQEPRRAAIDQPRRVDQHRRLHRVVDLVVERLDLLPQRDEAEDLAIEQVGANDLVRLRAGGLAEPVHERAADAIDHAVGHVRRDDLALQRMARHVRGVGLAQRLREIARQRGPDPRVVGQRRRQQLVVEPDLRVREQHRALGAGEAEPLGAPRGDLLVVGKILDRAVQASRLFEVLDEALLRIEQLRRDAAGHRKRLRLEVVVAQDQRGDVVGHLGEQRVALLLGQLAVGDRQAEQDLDVDLVIGGVDAGGVVDRIGVDAAAGQRVLDPARAACSPDCRLRRRPCSAGRGR